MAVSDEPRPLLRIFLNYRRDDSAGYALSLHRDLSDHFGHDHVFMDIDTIAPGENFVERIEQTLDDCDIVVALIGRDWVHSQDEAGNRRLEDPDDFVRLELAKALGRNIPVVPTLVHGARMPRKTDLPEQLAPLVLRQAVELRDSSWRDDVEHLIEDFERLAQKRSGATAVVETPPVRSRRRLAPPRPHAPGNVTVPALIRRRWKWLAAACIAAVVAVVVAVVALSGSASAAAIGPPGTIAFLDAGVLSKMNSDGGDQAQLYPPTLQSTGYKTGVFTTATIHPSWSPDRRHIAFANAGDIWVLNANGDVKDITKNTPALKQDSPAWSPDGRRIAYGQYTTGSCTPVCERIYVMNADGSHPVGLNTASGEWADWAPSWSPDGKRIAYASNKGDTGEEQENIWVMNANGSDAHRVTHLRGWNIRPAWSPDGKWIAFESDANSSDFANCDKADQCRYNIAVVDAAGRQRPHLVTSLTDPTSDMFPAWISPTRLLFTANDVSNPQVNTSGNIWAIDLSGKNLKKITTDGSSQWAAPAR